MEMNFLTIARTFKPFDTDISCNANCQENVGKKNKHAE